MQSMNMAGKEPVELILQAVLTLLGPLSWCNILAVFLVSKVRLSEEVCRQYARSDGTVIPWANSGDLRRAAGYYLIGQMISSFGNILAYGLTQIAHNPERDGWKWIFIVEGALTIGFGVLAWFVIPDMPYNVEKNKWLSTEEKDVVKQSLLKDRGDFEESKVTWKVIKSILKRPHMWALWVTSDSCWAQNKKKAN